MNNFTRLRSAWYPAIDEVGYHGRQIRQVPLDAKTWQATLGEIIAAGHRATLAGDPVDDAISAIWTDGQVSDLRKLMDSDRVSLVDARWQGIPLHANFWIDQAGTVITSTELEQDLKELKDELDIRLGEGIDRLV